MKKTLINTRLLRRLLLMSFLIGANLSYGQFTQNLLSESWTKTGGQGIAYKNVTVADINRNLYVVGATMSGVNNSDIIIQKINRSGTLLWEQTYAGTAGMNDAATAVFVDGDFNVYITGTVVNSVANDQDMIVLKYNSNGVLQWDFVYHGSDIHKQDAGTAITGDAAGNYLYVTGTSGNDTEMYNYQTFSLSPSTGSIIWSQAYDYDLLADIPKKILFSGSYVTVMGASQEGVSPVHWEMATVRYNYATGAFVDAVRSNSNTVTGIQEINDFAVDVSSGDIYLTGAIENPSTGFDVAVYKLDASLNLVWENYYDINGSDDKGTGIAFASGNMYLTGYSTKSGLGKETLIMKINSSGSVVWQREISGSKGLDDKGEQIILDANGHIYVASSVNDGNHLDYKLYCYDLNGNYLAATSYNGAGNLNDVPQSIEVDLDNNIIVTGYEQTGPAAYITKTIKYAFFERAYDYAYDGTEPTHLKGKILVSFNPARMKADAINARKFQAGQLHEFVDSTTLAAIQVKTGENWSRFNTYKVFKKMTPADSLSVTRLGDTIRAVDFWTYLSIDIPDTWNVYAMCDTLDSLAGYIRRSYPDVLAKLYGIPNDQLFSTEQLGLYDNPTYPDADINAVDAWDIEVGRSNVKVGIMDAPINWAHEEFNNGDGNLPGPAQKIGGGYNYYSNNEIHLYDQYMSYAHGTSVAGIVGARRNNYVPGNDGSAQGIAGIAGGDMGTGNFGVQLFSLGIANGPTSLVPMEVVAEALHDAYSNSPANTHDLGLNIINGSWGTNVNPYFLIHDEIEECWRNHCIYVAARGDFSSQGNHPVWPACYEDPMLINVMASGTNGEIKETGINGSGDWSSNSGLSGANNTLACPADIMAPGTTELVSSSTPFNNYATFQGTSASAPHVTGVAALMYSQHQENNGYPNKLSTEDIEKVMEKTATDRGSAVGFDWESGYGLLNAYEAVRQIFEPYYVKHLTAIPTRTETTGLIIRLYTDQPDLPNGELITNCKKVILNWNVDVTLPGGHEIIDWWELEAGTDKGLHPNPPGIDLFSTRHIATNTLFNPIGGNQVHKTASVATYFINRPSNPFWYPMHPDDMRYQFSVHVLKGAEAGIEELEHENFVLYPNPSNQNITIKSISAAQISAYEIVDATGRIIAKENKVNGNEFTVNIVPLTQGIYYCRVFSMSSVETIPFIKSKE